MYNSDAGIAFYEPVNTSHKYMVGASQKINSYLSANLPIVNSKQKQFKDFNQKYKCSINVDINNPYKIAKSILIILSNDKKYNKLKKNSNIAFKNKFNFEKQLEKIRKFL
tara:strand:- start:1588 stop:1917 length:330 start_codon:yes stop_codon:yes gene_type:complete